MDDSGVDRLRGRLITIIIGGISERPNQPLVVLKGRRS